MSDFDVKIAEMQKDIRSLEIRVDEIEKEEKKIENLNLDYQRLNLSLDSILSKLNDVTIKVDKLEKKPLEWQEFIIKYVVTTLLGVLIGYLI